MTSPTVAVIIPCHNEAVFLPDLLSTLIPQIVAQPNWQLVLVNDGSTDETGEIVDSAGNRWPEIITVQHGRHGGPGAARTTAVAIACADHARSPEWILTTDADVVLPDNWVSAWSTTLAALDADNTVGAVNGEEEQAHLLAPYPNAQVLSQRFGEVVVRSESILGPTNLNGVNHAVRTEAYIACGPYRQPVGDGPNGPIMLAGEDWDLGVRLRLAGYRIASTEVAVADRGRRLLADLVAYLGGTAYEGAFTRVEASGPTIDVTGEQLAQLLPGTARRALLHFYAKPILAVPRLLDTPLGLNASTVIDMKAWIERWPSPTFAESRNGFIYGRLPRFVDAFADTVLEQLGLCS
ncbi:MAG: glycosyltransferase family 2 protein [Acidimicrobiia bacterium]